MNECRLRRAVCEVRRPRLDPGEVGDVHNTTAGSQVRNRRLRDQKRRAEIESEDFVPSIAAGLSDSSRGERCSGINDDIELAKLMRGVFDNGGACVGLTQITLDGKRATTATLNLCDDVARGRSRVVEVDRDVESVVGQPFAYCASEPERTSRYQRKTVGGHVIR